MAGFALFSLPDLIADWRNASLQHKTVTVFGIGATSFWTGFSFAAGTWWAHGAPFLVGLGYGLDAGAASLVAICIVMGVPIAYPRAKLDEIA